MTPTICRNASASASATGSCKRLARPGDIVTLELELVPENGYVPEPLFDTGRIHFILGWGNYLPGVHELVTGKAVGESVSGVAIDAGWGRRNEAMVIRVPKSKLADLATQIEVGSTLKLAGGVQVSVSDILEDEVVLDANPPLAGSSYLCSFTVLAIDDVPTKVHCDESDRYQLATFALGCFWGAELAFMRQPGVVGTKVGYSQGITANPTYQDICDGHTKHREAVMVVYVSSVVSYDELVQLALERLTQTTSAFDLSQVFERQGDEVIQYRHGFYYHNEQQKEIAQKALDDNQNRFRVELLEATTFFDAEEQHQQYLYKGGQSACKGAKEIIRCYG